MTSNKVRKNRINKAIAEIEKDFCKEEIEIKMNQMSEAIDLLREAKVIRWNINVTTVDHMVNLILSK